MTCNVVHPYWCTGVNTEKWTVLFIPYTDNTNTSMISPHKINKIIFLQCWVLELGWPPMDHNLTDHTSKQLTCTDRIVWALFSIHSNSLLWHWHYPNFDVPLRSLDLESCLTSSTVSTVLIFSKNRLLASLILLYCFLLSWFPFSPLLFPSFSLLCIWSVVL